MDAERTNTDVLAPAGSKANGLKQRRSLSARTEKAYGRIIRQQRLRIKALEKETAQLKVLVTQLQGQVARLSKNSSTSSKPPSSDIVKPPKPPAGKGGGKIGGQPGHPRHERQPFGPEQIDRVKKYHLTECPDCGGQVRPAPVPLRVIQQVELVPQPVQVVEHQAVAFECVQCGKVHYAPLPPEVEQGGLCGPQLTALVAYLKGVCHGSFSTIRKFCRDVLKFTISRGQLAKLIQKATAAMDFAYAQLRASLPQEGRLNVDETGHKEKGKPYWTWCFRAELYTLFKIDPSRGSEVLVEVLSRDFDGVVGCDYFSAYRKYMGDFSVAVQFCLAHLIRDVKFLTTLPDAVTRNYGQRVLEGLRKLFHVIHRREKMDAGRFQHALEQARDQLVAVGKRAPQRSAAQNLADRFRLHGEAYFRFITAPGVAPTNNLAEQAIRFVVMDRHMTQGTRSERGRRWCERMWTAVATCTQQGRSVFTYLQDAIQAHLRGQQAPSLLPAGP
jgi:transposase